MLATGTAENDLGVVVILRHEAIPYAMESAFGRNINLAICLKLMIQTQYSIRQEYVLAAKGR